MRKWKLENGLTKVELELDNEIVIMIIDEATGKVFSGEEKVPSISSKSIKIYTNKESEIHSRLGPAINYAEKDIFAYYINSKRLTEEEFIKHPEVMNFKKSLIDLDSKSEEDDSI